MALTALRRCADRRGRNTFVVACEYSPRLCPTVHGRSDDKQPFHGFSLVFFVATTYIALDTGMGFTSVFKSVPPNELKNIGLFILVWLWPAVYAQSPRPVTSIPDVLTARPRSPGQYCCTLVSCVTSFSPSCKSESRAVCSLSLPLMSGAESLTVLYIGSFLVFVGSQVVYMIPSKVLCQVGRYPR